MRRNLQLSARRDSLLAEAPSKRRVTTERGLSHNDEARSRQVRDDPLGGDLGYVLVGLMHPLFAAIAQGESDCLGKVVRVAIFVADVGGHSRLIGRGRDGYLLLRSYRSAFR
jgi:hypothetical protein